MRLAVARLSELDRPGPPDGAGGPHGPVAIKVAFHRRGYPETAILVRMGGSLRAWVNRCRHRPLPLDYDDGRFWDPEQPLLLCRTHGARYEPLSGLCVAGPCAGDALEELAVVAEGDTVFLDLDEPGG